MNVTPNGSGRTPHGSETSIKATSNVKEIADSTEDLDELVMSPEANANLNVAEHQSQLGINHAPVTPQLEQQFKEMAGWTPDSAQMQIFRDGLQGNATLERDPGIQKDIKVKEGVELIIKQYKQLAKAYQELIDQSSSLEEAQKLKIRKTLTTGIESTDPNAINDAVETADEDATSFLNENLQNQFIDLRTLNHQIDEVQDNIDQLRKNKMEDFQSSMLNQLKIEFTEEEKNKDASEIIELTIQKMTTMKRTAGTLITSLTEALESTYNKEDENNTKIKELLAKVKDKENKIIKLLIDNRNLTNLIKKKDDLRPDISGFPNTDGSPLDDLIGHIADTTAQSRRESLLNSNQDEDKDTDQNSVTAQADNDSSETDTLAVTFEDAENENPNTLSKWSAAHVDKFNQKYGMKFSNLDVTNNVSTLMEFSDKFEENSKVFQTMVKNGKINCKDIINNKFTKTVKDIGSIQKNTLISDIFNNPTYLKILLDALPETPKNQY